MNADTATGDPRSERIVSAATELLSERGYASVSTLDIANRARVSKRELYRLFDNKDAIIEACIARRVALLRPPLMHRPPTDQRALVAMLTAFGTSVLRELSDPAVLALYRLAVATLDESPSIAAAFDTSGRQVIREALVRVLAQAQPVGAIGTGDPSSMAGEFYGLLWGDLQVRLLLGVAKRPTTAECRRRATAAAGALV